MNNKTLLCLVSMAAVAAVDASAAIRVGNLSRSYADAYTSVNTYNDSANGVTATTADVNDSLPVRVGNLDLATRIARGDTSVDTTVADLESCAMIYPTGEFRWDTPTLGIHAGGNMTCVAVVEMRDTKKKEVDGSDLVLARAYVAAGDSFTCNISEFPESSYTLAAENVEFPADAEPTMDDVIRVMNDEQKKNAGLKIVAGAVIGGLTGNFTGKNDAGNTSMLGTDKGKMQNSAIGALSGAALMAGNAYGGKVAGDTILSAGVNAMAGGLIGNMTASGNQVMRIEKCKLPGGRETNCLWGVVQLGSSVSSEFDKGKTTYFYNIDTDSVVACTVKKEPDSNDGVLKNKECNPTYLNNIMLKGYGHLDTAITEKFAKVYNNTIPSFGLDNKEKEIKAKSGDTTEGTWVEIQSARTSDKEILAMVADVPDRALGMNRAKWIEWRKNNPNAVVYGRDNNGDAYDLKDKANNPYTVMDFSPATESGTDGGLIDFGNRARTKATLTGAGAGAGLGALSGYQGAQSDVQDRWVTEVRQYQDSLEKIYCGTGKRFLGYYNSQLLIPSPTSGK